jgi:hypothetical protein
VAGIQGQVHVLMETAELLAFTEVVPSLSICQRCKSVATLTIGLRW